MSDTFQPKTGYAVLNLKPGEERRFGTIEAREGDGGAIPVTGVETYHLSWDDGGMPRSAVSANEIAPLAAAGSRLFYIVIRPIWDAGVDLVDNTPPIGHYAEFSENVPSWLNPEFVRDAQGKCRVFNTAQLALTAAKETINQRLDGH